MADLSNAPDAINIGQLTAATLATIETRVELATSPAIPVSSL